jgi:hypothetical protein
MLYVLGLLQMKLVGTISKRRRVFLQNFREVYGDFSNSGGGGGPLIETLLPR